jgi:hypothetical protein
MTKKEFADMIDRLHKQGMKDEDILAMFYRMYAEGRLPYKALVLFADELGYVPSPEFDTMSDEERKKAGFEKKGN